MVTEVLEGASAHLDPPKGKAQVMEFPEGGFAPPDPPTTSFQKICPPGKFFEMIKTAPLPQTVSPKAETMGGTGGGAVALPGPSVVRRPCGGRPTEVS